MSNELHPSNDQTWSELEIFMRRRIAQSRSLGIDHVVLTPLQLAKIFSLGLDLSTPRQLEEEFAYWVMSEPALHAEVLAAHCRGELQAGTPFSVWSSRNAAPGTPWSDYGFAGLTVDLTGVFPRGFSEHEGAVMVTANDWSASSTPSLWHQFDEVTQHARKMWSDERARVSLVSVLLACKEAFLDGTLEPALAPIAIAVRMCLCQFTIVGQDILARPTTEPIIPIATSSSLPGMNVDGPAVLHALRHMSIDDFTEQASVEREAIAGVLRAAVAH